MNFSHLFNTKTTPPTAAQLSITELEAEIEHAVNAVDSRLYTLQYDKMTALRAQYCNKSDDLPLMAFVTKNGDLIAIVPTFCQNGCHSTRGTDGMHLGFIDERALTAAELGNLFE